MSSLRDLVNESLVIPVSPAYKRFHVDEERKFLGGKYMEMLDADRPGFAATVKEVSGVLWSALELAISPFIAVEVMAAEGAGSVEELMAQAPALLGGITPADWLAKQQAVLEFVSMPVDVLSDMLGNDEVFGSVRESPPLDPVERVLEVRYSQCGDVAFFTLVSMMIAETKEAPGTAMEIFNRLFPGEIKQGVADLLVGFEGVRDNFASMLERQRRYLLND